jgi:Domain of unknown function (DUF5060)
MQKNRYAALILLSSALLVATLAAGCSAATTSPTVTPTIQKTAAPTATPDLPVISAAVADRSELPDYESLTLSVTLKAKYSNPYDLRQVSLDGVFSRPDGKQMKVPGFWDGDSSWQVRFTPSQVGAWNYRLTVTDGRGTSLPYQGTFTVTASDLHGWLQAGNWVNPAYSGHYLVYQDGTPFYGIGHDDALNILWDGFKLDSGVTLFNDMKKAGENYVVWWPLYTTSPLSTSYNDYSAANMKIIDLIVADAQKKGILLVFTIWDHPELRDSTHAWGNGNWDKNGFHLLDENISSFFTSQEAWAWQENFYRYVIARWGYSPAIGMWQTVSEINGTNAYAQTDPWHKQVNDYFVANDPYRHPTTASMSGDTPWPAGFQVMDAPQMHVYNFKNGSQPADAVKAADVLAQWTSLMWSQGDKPNWVGEFGTPGDTYYPELFHNSIWAALGSGAAMTPAKWNSGGDWGEMTPAMLADIARLGQFVSGMPLAQWDPAPLHISSSDPQVRGWGVAGKAGGLLWVQDFSLEGQSIDVVRASQTVRKGVKMEIQGLAGGNYTITPYDTWQGTFLSAITVTCADGQPCTVALPDFKADMAFKIEGK